MKLANIRYDYCNCCLRHIVLNGWLCNICVNKYREILDEAIYCIKYRTIEKAESHLYLKIPCISVRVARAIADDLKNEVM